jgi:O-methyltransferase
MPFRQLLERIERKRVTKQILPYTLVSVERIHNLYALAHRIEAEGIPGDAVECGVCNGGTAALIARTATRSKLNRIVWLLDSFQGMPKVTDEDADGPGGDSAKAHVGKEVGMEASVRDVLDRVGAKMDRVQIIAGWFQDTFPLVTAKKIALLNIDADWYESVKLCLDTFYDRVVPGGFISIDDYGHWPGCKRAVDEFLNQRGISTELRSVDYTARWFQKL